MHTPRHTQSGFIGSTLLAVITLAVIVAVFVNKTSYSLGAQTQAVLATQAVIASNTRKLTVAQTAALLSAEATLDSDGYPLPGAMAPGDPAPAGGGWLPTTSQASGFASGKALGYCAWDNGAVTSNEGRLPGSNSPATPAFAVISAGKDGIFQTSCAQAGALAPQGDDVAEVYVTTQLRKLTDLPPQ